MSLDIYLEEVKPVEVHWQNITHNLNKIASEAGIYNCLWHPDKAEIKKAMHLIKPLTQAIADMKDRPDHYKKFDAENGWGTYDDFLPWLECLLKACINNPSADVRVSI